MAQPRTESTRMVHLRPGLKVFIADFQPMDAHRHPFMADDAFLRFSFLREAKGHMDTSVSSGTAVNRRILPMERSSTVSFYPELESTLFFPAGYRQFHVSIQISPSLLHTVLGGRFQRIPHELQAIVDGCNTIDFYHRGSLSPLMDAALSQLLNCPYSGQLGLIFQESKAIELIAHKLAQIQASFKTDPPWVKPHSDDVQRVRAAKDILEKNLDTPPRLVALAQAVGTSHTQLNRGFKMMYGTSVFAYLRKMRLEEARCLLEKGRMNVTEAAIAVGYNSISSFSRAFSDHFGVTPLRCLKKDQPYKI
jgi:AraC family transcriptional regulator, transcriptional activator of the genes for pyochelin and ferripyochelin receptors